jgi:hypothetical protein
VEMFVYKIRLALEYRHGHVTGFVLRRWPFCTNFVVAGKMADILLPDFAFLSQALAVMRRCWLCVGRCINFMYMNPCLVI